MEPSSLGTDGIKNIPKNWKIVISPKARYVKRGEGHTRGMNGTKKLIEISPMLSILGSSVKEWYCGPPKEDVKVAIVTRDVNISMINDLGSHWGVYADGKIWHCYGSANKEGKWIFNDTFERFSRGLFNVTYVLHDNYYLPVSQRIKDGYHPGDYHALLNNCQHAVQKIVFGETIVKQASPILHFLDVTTDHNATQYTGVWTDVEDPSTSVK